MNPALDTSIRDLNDSLRLAGQAFPAETDPLFVALRETQRRMGTVSLRLRRAFNVTVALIALLIFLPVMLVVAVLIKLTSPGPVIYKQTRVGVDRRSPGSTWRGGRRGVDYGGRLFTIYKFRTMRADPRATLQVWARHDDNRITAIGRILRKYRLDELPQLLNVIKGDMNIVGPRPEQPNIFIKLREEIHHYPLRQQVLPGITGWAQINQHYDTCLDDVRRKVQFDLEYIQEQSVLQDMRILIRTVPVMVFQRGAL